MPPPRQEGQAMKTIVTKAEVVEYMSDWAGEYMANGYVLNVCGEKRFYGTSNLDIELRERGKSTKGVRIALCQKGNHLALEAREFDLGARGDDWFEGWFRGEVVDTIDLYQISYGNREVFTTDSGIAEKAVRKREQRSEARRISEKRAVSCIRPEQVIGLVRRRSGYCRAKVEDIDFVGKRPHLCLRAGYDWQPEGMFYYVRFNRKVSKAAQMVLELNS